MAAVKKITLVESKNPTWADLAAGWYGKADSSPAARAQNDAPWKRVEKPGTGAKAPTPAAAFPPVSTALGNRPKGKSVRFPHFHRRDGWSLPAIQMSSSALPTTIAVPCTKKRLTGIVVSRDDGR
jgi:hypothetical protein